MHFVSASQLPCTAPRCWSFVVHGRGEWSRRVRAPGSASGEGGARAEGRGRPSLPPPEHRRLRARAGGRRERRAAYTSSETNGKCLRTVGKVCSYRAAVPGFLGVASEGQGWPSGPAPSSGQAPRPPRSWASGSPARCGSSRRLSGRKPSCCPGSPIWTGRVGRRPLQAAPRGQRGLRPALQPQEAGRSSAWRAPAIPGVGRGPRGGVRSPVQIPPPLCFQLPPPLTRGPRLSATSFRIPKRKGNGGRRAG
ncbi:uncharacterized protein LOC122449371 [Cervus canadensis]|uniref:uncharacterized protein LOC122449371 n=1 Tax=Cervus canadensis TaxID=1574408 RepID=UPI001C9E307C|nr:uncharacterized protein LOC122449371 [Cervus canadensis]